ncbi:two-component response regulator [hydrothermal vent metagenome]|uniref:Two-component response regulator n=1 Tax=hydrothermal vent metagenome TaxID=652676 RepID=A0A1W1D5P5_9ZZZZ
MRKKILLLEDDIDLAQTLQELLEEENYDVTMVHNGSDAIDASYENKYDLYVFDINVPDMDGLELLESLRKADDQTPAIFISALVDMNSIAKAFEIGANDYIKKPFFPQELLIRVNAKFTAKSKDIIYNNLRYDVDKKTLYQNDTLISLGEVQQCLCHLFFTNIGKVLDKTILMDCLIQASEQSLRVAINKLKQVTKLPIKNVRGIGYIIEKS